MKLANIIGSSRYAKLYCSATTSHRIASPLTTVLTNRLPNIRINAKIQAGENPSIGVRLKRDVATSPRMTTRNAPSEIVKFRSPGRAICQDTEKMPTSRNP